MQSRDFPIGLVSNPLVNSPFNQRFGNAMEPPPSSGIFMIMENGPFMQSEDGYLMVTES